MKGGVVPNGDLPFDAFGCGHRAVDIIDRVGAVATASYHTQTAAMIDTRWKLPAVIRSFDWPLGAPLPGSSDRRVPAYWAWQNSGKSMLTLHRASVVRGSPLETRSRIERVRNGSGGCGWVSTAQIRVDDGHDWRGTWGAHRDRWTPPPTVA